MDNKEKCEKFICDKDLIVFYFNEKTNLTKSKCVDSFMYLSVYKKELGSEDSNGNYIISMIYIDKFNKFHTIKTYEDIEKIKLVEYKKLAKFSLKKIIRSRLYSLEHHLHNYNRKH